MTLIFKVNFEKYKDEDEIKLFFVFIKRDLNKIRIIHNNKIKSSKNALISQKSKIKFILLGIHHIYQSFNMKYNHKNKNKRHKVEHEIEKEEISIFGKKFVTNNFSKCLIMYKNEIFPLKEYFSRKYIDFDKKFEIKLLSFKNLSDFSYMFDG